MPTLSKKLRIFSLCLCFILLTSGCAKNQVTTGKSFDTFTDSTFREMVSSDTVSLHFHLSNPAASRVQTDKISFPAESYDSILQHYDDMDVTQKTLSAYQDALLSDEQQFTKKVMTDYFTRQYALKPYILFYNPFGSNSSTGSLVRTLTLYAFDKESDVKDYLALLVKVPDLFQEAITFEKLRQKNDIFLSGIQLEEIQSEVNAILNSSDEDNLLLLGFEEKISAMNDLSKDQKNTYINNNKKLIHETVLPAFEELKNYLESLKIPADSKERICQYEQGQAYYEALLHAAVGTDLSPTECILVLENQVAECIASTNTLLSSNPDLSLEYQTALPALTDIDEILTELSADTSIHFPEIPDVKCVVKEMPAALSSVSSSAFYLLPPLDNHETNNIYVDSSRISREEIFSTLAHEAYPGHLYQKNYMLSLNLAPIRHLTGCEGYDEGWGMYSQIYGYRYLEFEQTDQTVTQALQSLYQNQDILNICLLSLSDLYVNYKNYDEKRLGEYLKAYGIDSDRTNTVYEYVVTHPCTYLTYGVGYYEFNKLLTKTKARLEDKFDLKEFHTAVLGAGSCSFGCLEEYLEENL